MQLRKWICSGMALGLFCVQTSLHAEAPKISGFIDTTYGYDFNKPASRTTSFRSLDKRTDTFLLNAAQINIEGSQDGIGYYAELVYGTDASVTKAAGTGIDSGLPAAPSSVAYNVDLQEAFLTYKCPVTGIQLKAGKFVTFEGIEVVEAKDNFNISRGFLYSWAEPTTHVGAMIGYALPKYVDFWVGVVNGWDVLTDNNTGKTIVAKVGITPSDKVSGVVSLLRGAEKANNTNDSRTSFDTVWTIKPVDKFALALQANAGEEEKSSLIDGGAAHWYGFGLQPKVTLCDKVSIGSRYEWFSDLDGARTGSRQILNTIAITPTVNLTESLMFRVEYRYDWSTRLVYETSDGAISKGETSTISTQFIYKF